MTDAAGATYSKTVLAGQCSEPFQVAAGISEVVEGPSPGYDLVDVATIPEDRLLTTNLINRTADVEVPASDSSNDETQLHFVNQTQRGQLKVCKALGPGSSDLIGEDFYFSVRRDGAPDVTGIEITAQASTQCVIVGYFPIGSTVDVEENIEVKGFDQVDPSRGDFIDTTGEGEITISPGINTKTITNNGQGPARGLQGTRGLREDARGPAVDRRAAHVPIPHRCGHAVHRPGGQVLTAEAGVGRQPHRHGAGKHDGVPCRRHCRSVRARSDRAG